MTTKVNINWGDGVAQLVERQPQDPMDSMIRGTNPVRSTRKICESFSELKCCAYLLLVCPTPVCIRTHNNDHIRTLKIPQSMSEFDGLRKHKKTQHALVGLGSAALTAAVALPR